MNPELEKAVSILRRGGLVVFPTETVYGLGADAHNPEAVKKIFSVKGRPQAHPVIVHISTLEQIEQWACAVPEAAYQLAERFWPGPLTLVLRRAAGVSDVITGGQNTIGLRMPAHHIAQALLAAFGNGIAAPSANRYGHISPTTAQHVFRELGDKVDLILDGGSCAVGIESTIVDLSAEHPALLRPGWISVQQLSATIKQRLVEAQVTSPRVPGSTTSHYAPDTKLALINAEQLTMVADKLVGEGKKVAVLARSEPLKSCAHIIWRVAPQSAAGYARTLYANLRELDALSCDWILVEPPPGGPDWDAIKDRLARATVGCGDEDFD